MKITILISLLFFTVYGFSQKQVDTTTTKGDSLKVANISVAETILKTDSIRPKGITAPYEYKDSTFLKQYIKVAFNPGRDSLSENTTMKYWKDDIKIFFSKSVSRKVKKELMSFAKTISKQVDSLNISKVRKLEQSNYVIYYFGDYEYESRMKNNKKTGYQMYWNGKNQIYKVATKLDANSLFNDELRVYELKKQLFQSLGHFVFDSDLVCEDYFSGCFSENKELSTLDLELLKYHYSYGICKGTDLQTFEEQHAKAKENLKINHTKTMFFHEE